MKFHFFVSLPATINSSHTYTHTCKQTMETFASPTLFAHLRWRLSLIWRVIIGIIIPFALLPILLIKDDDDNKKFKAAYTILVVALYWMFEVIPLAVTSLIPLVLFPLLGVLDTSKVAPTYFKETNVMFFGGLVLALSIEHCNLHKRIALRILTLVGIRPVRLLFGLMITSMSLSMWMSNTACTAMLLPICGAIILQLCPDPMEGMETMENVEIHVRKLKIWRNHKKMYMLGIAYSSNIGGIGTLTGTGPNLIFQNMLTSWNTSKRNNNYFNDVDVNFLNWMALNVPAAIIITFVAFLYLIVRFHGLPKIFKRRRSTGTETVNDDTNNKMDEEEQNYKRVEALMENEYKQLGPMTFQQYAVFSIFLFVVIGWVFRDPKFINGWGKYFSGGGAVIGDSSVAVLGILLLFLIPKDATFFTGSPTKGQQYEALLDWKFVQRNLSWGILLLLGAGFALSEGCVQSGLSEYIGSKLTGFGSLPHPIILLLVMCLTATITEISSNLATANIILPILLQMSSNIGIHPMYLTLPAAISCSFAFMLPVATPPNALVFSTGYLQIRDMVTTGIFLNFASILVYFFIHITLGEIIFNFSGYEQHENVTMSVY